MQSSDLEAPHSFGRKLQCWGAAQVSKFHWSWVSSFNFSLKLSFKFQRQSYFSSFKMSLINHWTPIDLGFHFLVTVIERYRSDSPAHLLLEIIIRIQLGLSLQWREGLPTYLNKICIQSASLVFFLRNVSVFNLSNYRAISFWQIIAPDHFFLQVVTHRGAFRSKFVTSLMGSLTDL